MHRIEFQGYTRFCLQQQLLDLFHYAPVLDPAQRSEEAWLGVEVALEERSLHNLCNLNELVRAVGTERGVREREELVWIDRVVVEGGDGGWCRSGAGWDGREGSQELLPSIGQVAHEHVDRHFR